MPGAKHNDRRPRFYLREFVASTRQNFALADDFAEFPCF